jgi:serine protease Do
MNKLRHYLATFWILIITVSPTLADKYTELWYEFDARPLTHNEKKFLQASLAFGGFYNGLLDGAWGKRSQAALEKYSWAEFNADPQQWHMAMLAFGFFEEFESDGWQLEFNENLGVSLFLPTTKIYQGANSAKFQNWYHSNSSFRVSFAVGNLAATNNFHDFTAKTHKVNRPIYSVRRKGFAVTSAQSLDGTILYTRSNYVNGRWSTVMLSADKRDENILQAVASSLAVGRQPSLDFPLGGKLERIISLTLDFLKQNESRRDKSDGGEEPKAVSGSSGTAFYVSKSGDVLTNAHVVEGCSEIRVDGVISFVTDISKTFDLALVKVNTVASVVPAVFSAQPARLNSDVTVIGYPLTGLLGGINVTRGTVSSLTGIQGDSSKMQISAPVQPGNSGGPVLNSTGAVVGVVVSKLNAKKMADLIGVIPQNVNFAIRSEIARLFLFQNGIEPVLVNGGEAISPVVLAEEATKYTAHVSCD